MGDLDALLAAASADAWWSCTVAVSLRLAPVCLLSPIFGASRIPWSVRGAALGVLTLALVPPLALSGAGPTPDTGAAWTALAMRELALGMSLTAMTAVALWGIGLGFGVIDRVWGHGLSTDDALTSGPISELGVALATATFVAAGGHVVFVGAVGHTFAAIPPSAEAALPDAWTVVGTLGELFVVAGVVALPAVAALWIAQLGEAFIERAAPAWIGALRLIPMRALLLTLVLLAGLHLVVDLALDGTVDAIDAASDVLGGGG